MLHATAMAQPRTPPKTMAQSRTLPNMMAQSRTPPKTMAQPRTPPKSMPKLSGPNGGGSEVIDLTAEEDTAKVVTKPSLMTANGPKPAPGVYVTVKLFVTTMGCNFIVFFSTSIS